MKPEVFSDVLILTGPTGSGKSQLALELAPGLNAEIVAMDSMTLYRGMDIGTAKPSLAEQKLVPHHLLDLLDPWESASVAWWLDQAARTVADIQRRGKRALFVGGTALYLKALLQGLFDGPPADPHLRHLLEEEARTMGKQAIHDRLRSVDPGTAARVHFNDLRRVIRALEVYTLTGRPISDWQTQWRREEGSTNADDRCLCVDLPREELYLRINNRVVQMVNAGLVEEVRRLHQLDRPLSREAQQALGYKELWDHLDGRGSLEEAVRIIQMRSRNFAKRQLTWFRHLEGCRIVRPELTIAIWHSRMKERDC
jgi:tRNA dimethylallyltransferase